MFGRLSKFKRSQPEGNREGSVGDWVDGEIVVFEEQALFWI